METENNLDLNGDGVVEDKELQIFSRKQTAQRRMATAALVSMITLTVVLLSGIISESLINATSDLISTFYFAMAGVVGAYMGMSAWMAKK